MLEAEVERLTAAIESVFPSLVRTLRDALSNQLATLGKRGLLSRELRPGRAAVGGRSCTHDQPGVDRSSRRETT